MIEDNEGDNFSSESDCIPSNGNSGEDIALRETGSARQDSSAGQENDGQADKLKPKTSEDKGPEGGDCEAPSSKSCWHKADTMAIVAEFLDLSEVEVGGDFSLRIRGRPMRADLPATVREFLSLAPTEYSDLVDRLGLHVKALGLRAKTSHLKASLRQVMSYRANKRRADLLTSLVDAGVAGVDPELAGREWDAVCSLYLMPCNLSKAILRNYMFGVYQKILGRPIDYPLMPVVFSPMQGSGKTTNVKQLVSPFEELASDAALLSDFVDCRSGAIYRFPIVFLDDMERIEGPAVSILKSLLTAEGVRRRRLGTSESVRIRQGAMPIGTANASIQTLIPDETGHRRFVSLPFRNGQVANGGDVDVWDIVSSVDYRVLWASVDPFGSSPIAPYLDELFAYQGGGRSISRMQEWLEGLDFQSEDLLRAQGLHDLFMMQTGTRISGFRFAQELILCLRHPECPFSGKIKTEHGFVYLRKPKMN